MALTKIGPYEILEEIGAGGMATVYLARQESMGRFVAVKVIHRAITSDSTTLERFQRVGKGVDCPAIFRQRHTCAGEQVAVGRLDVEQIGYVYEGLLERTVKRTAEVTLELDGTKNAKAPWVKLAE
ncbi:hypothetical protein FBQ85_15760, partial [Cytophagia bacterium CHB2]|nr:hypothetical protein [Cytophagia bacterium CHB2]